MGSLTSTLIGTALWLRSVISNSASQTYSPIRVKSVCFRSQTTSKALPIWSVSVSSFGVWSMRASPMNCAPPC